jgi:hypothetical protein
MKANVHAYSSGPSDKVNRRQFVCQTSMPTPQIVTVPELCI